MIDISHKFNTLRYALVEAYVHASRDSILRIQENTVPKGDVLATARAAGIHAAKNASSFMTFCHSMPIDWVDLKFELLEDKIKITVEAKSVWKTGVEMEALAGASVAALNIYDMLKPIDENLSIGEIKLMKKKGGKSDHSDDFDPPLKTAVLVISDSTYEGTREDKSGLIIKDFLLKQPVSVDAYEILPDKPEMISNRLKELIDSEKFDLVFTTGGTGLGPKDYTPEATREVIEKEAPGIAEAIRRHGKDRTPFAMLSRELVGLRGTSLIINLPGSSKGARESLEALFPGLLHAFPMIWGGGHDSEGRARWKKKAKCQEKSLANAK